MTLIQGNINGIAESTKTILVDKNGNIGTNGASEILSNQITLSTTNQAITTIEKRGYVTLRISAGGTCYIGDETVTNTSGYLIDDSSTTVTITLDDLSTLNVRGTGTLYIFGGYSA